MKTLIMILLALSLVLVACSQASTDDAIDANAQGVAGTTTETKAAEKVDKAAGSSGEAEFLKLLNQKANLEWKVAYDLKSTYVGKTTNMQMTEYMKTEKKIRMDSAFDGIETQTFMVTDVYTTCSKQDGSWSCFKLDAKKTDGVDVQATEQKMEDNPNDYEITSDGTMQIAGVTATCFKIVSKQDKYTNRYCFKDAVPLYVYVQTEDGTSEMKATSYSTKVSDSDFVPPAKAQDMGALTAGVGSGAGIGSDSKMPCNYCDYMSGSEKTDCLKSCS